MEYRKLIYQTHIIVNNCEDQQSIMLSGKVVTIIYLKEIIMKSNSLILPINLEQIAILIKGMPHINGRN